MAFRGFYEQLGAANVAGHSWPIADLGHSWHPARVANDDDLGHSWHPARVANDDDLGHSWHPARVANDDLGHSWHPARDTNDDLEVSNYVPWYKPRSDAPSSMWTLPARLGADNNLPSYKPRSDELSLGWGVSGVAQSCNDLWGTCKQGCGPDAIFPDCKSRGGSCTPYSFMPNVDNQNCPDWMDSGEFSSQPFFQYSNEYSFQAFAAPGSDDVWILHGCDGAGIQTDCRGDIFYLEHFGSKQTVAPQDCPLSTYGKTHESCPTFYHQGYDKVFPDYTCGWWRGFKQPTGIEEASKQGVGAFGPAGDDKSYGDAMRNILRNCPSCAYKSALEHPYKETDAIAYFVGAAWPWICNEGDDKNGTPYTGKQVSCYCDNEPGNGRQSIKGVATVPARTQIVYCGLYNTGFNLQLKCDFITLDTSNNRAKADFRGIEMYPTDF